MANMVTVADTPKFKELVDDYFDEESFEAFKEHIAQNPFEGVLIQQSQGVRKIRWPSPYGGKSGGYRILTCYDSDTQTVWLLMIYAKSNTQTVKGSQARKLRP